MSIDWVAFLGTILMAFRAFAADETSNSPPPTTLIIAAAADLKFALDDLVKEFEKENPATKVDVTYGSAGNFFAQLQNGAPFDLFFSADMSYPRKLAEAGLGADEVFIYAVGRIVVWVPKDSPVDVDSLGIKALLEPSIRQIAVANPRLAPYGRAAVAAMKALNVYKQVMPRLVYGENSAQTAQFVQSGSACSYRLSQRSPWLFLAYRSLGGWLSPPGVGNFLWKLWWRYLSFCPQQSWAFTYLSPSVRTAQSGKRMKR